MTTLGHKYSPESRAKMGAARKGRVLSLETRAKMSIAKRAYLATQPNHTEKLRQRLKNTEFVTESGCEIWMGCTDRDGYGLIWNGDPRGCCAAHRVAWQLKCGPIPAKMLVCHRCDVPSCINVDHLFLGTPKENTYDAIRKGRPLGKHTHKERKTQ